MESRTFQFACRGVVTAVVLALALLLPGCSIKRLAVNRVGDALAAGGTSFSSDDDPDLIRDAAPFSLKTMEVLLAEAPRHAELRRAAAAAFTQYAYAFVLVEADEREASDFSASEHLRLRARRLFLRARNHGLRGLEVRHPGFEARLRAGAAPALASMRREDVPLLYWTGASWAAAISQSKDQPALIGELPLVSAIMEKALELDPGWNRGAIPGFFIAFAPAQPGDPAEGARRAREFFDRAVKASDGGFAGTYVSLAESVCLPANQRDEFESLLTKALAIDPDKRPEWRLENLIFQRRARWLMGRIDELFVSPVPPRKSNP